MIGPLFPLLKLPYLGLELVLKLMSIDEQIRFSPISQNASLLIRNLRYTADFITLSVTNECISIILKFHRHSTLINYHLVPETYSITEHPKPRPFLDVPVAMMGEDGVVVKKESWRIRNWVDHVADAYNCRIFKLSVQSCDFYDIESVLSMFQGLDVIGVGIQDKKNGRKILGMFPPKQELVLEHNQGFDGLMTLSLNFLKLGYFFSVTVDNLIRMKSKNIEIGSCKINTADLNDFTKKWIGMETNQELETLSIKPSRFNMEREQVLNGITHLIVPNKRFETRYAAPNWEALGSLVGQYEIRRIDGKKATIQWFEFWNGGGGFKLVVDQE